MNKKEGKRGQVTIFIIIAILIIVLGILIYLYYPKIFSKVSTETKNPSAYIQECMQQKIEDTVETISLQGGSVNPEFYYSYYNGEGEDKIEYLCYTNQNYQKCIVQEPQLIAHIEQEILDTIEPSMENCFTLMVESYEKKGYDVNLKEGTPYVQIIPNEISTNFNRTLTLTKGDESQTYRNFKINLDSALYDMLNIATSIVYWETTQGGAPIDTFMDLYDLKIEKEQQIDGTEIYILSEFGSGEDKFQFAIRSLVRPQGITI